MQDVIYSWNPARKVVINPDMKMSQFDLIAVPVSNRTNSQRRGCVSLFYQVFNLVILNSDKIDKINSFLFYFILISFYYFIKYSISFLMFHLLWSGQTLILSHLIAMKDYQGCKCRVGDYVENRLN